MTDRLLIFPQPIQPGVAPVPKKPQVNSGSGDFARILDEQLQTGRLKFSRHAAHRLESRGIQFGPQQLQRLQQAVDRVQEKGGRDSLVLLDETALVVSVRNQTVVTVVDREQLKENVFTNIDSAIFA